MLKKVCFAIGLILIALIIYVPYVPLHSANNQTSNSREVKLEDKNIINESIYIYGNDDFLNKTSMYGWNGTGTLLDPILIKNHVFTAINSDYVIKIQLTDLYFVISDCVFQASLENRYIISLNQVLHATIENNVVNFVQGDGIHISLGAQIYIRNNTFNTAFGIAMESSINIYVLNNSFYNNTNGIELTLCNRIYLKNNVIWNNKFGENAINLIRASNSEIEENEISYFSHGIDTYQSNFNQISNNTIQNCTIAVYIEEKSTYNEIVDNRISNCQFGINVYSSANLNQIENNSFSNTSIEVNFREYTLNLDIFTMIFLATSLIELLIILVLLKKYFPKKK